jgi:DNA repair protein RadD
MKSLRYMQRECIDAIFAFWAENNGNPLAVMATGSGKAITLDSLMMEIVQQYEGMRLMMCTHVVELVGQNLEEMFGIWPSAPVGVYAAALNRRDRGAQILFAQLQTVWNKAADIGHVDLLVIDEVHLVPADSNTMYRKLIDALREINPDLKIVGFTATPYRLDSGRLDEGDDRLFDQVVYEYDIAQGIADGYLCRLTSKPTDTTYDLTGVHRLGGDFKRSELSAAIDKEDITERAVTEVMAACADRHCILVFCTSVAHANHVCESIRAHGKTCEVLTGKTPATERRKIIEAYKRGDIWAITNDSVMTTGTNVPRIDAIVDFAPTESCSRYVQKAGRGTRPIYAPGFDTETVEGRLSAIAAGPKPNCLYLNFAGNVERHGPVDMVEPKKPGKGQGEAPIKLCPQCDEICHASVRVCPCCGNQFEFDEAPKITAAPTAAPILSDDAPAWIRVVGRTFAEHVSAKSGLLSVKITFDTENGKSYSMWRCPAHDGRAKAQADRWWADHGESRPFPKTVEEFLDRAAAGELKVTTAITIKKATGTRFWNPDLEQIGEERDATFAKPPPREGNLVRKPYQWPAGTIDYEDSIPF